MIDYVCNHIRLGVETQHCLRQKHLLDSDWKLDPIKYNPTKDAYISTFKVIGREFSWQLTLDYCYWPKECGPWPWSLGDKIKNFLKDSNEGKYNSFDYDGKMITYQNNIIAIEDMTLTGSLAERFISWLEQVNNNVPTGNFIMKTAYIDRDQQYL